MRKYSLLNVVATVVLGSLLAVACKKPYHPSAPSPNNVRMLGYQKITTYKPSLSSAPIPNPVYETFRFYYDVKNRLSKIQYSVDGLSPKHYDYDFTYYGGNNDTIVKKTTDIIANLILQSDTFYTSNGLLTEAHTPFLINKYEYYGRLVARNIRTATTYRNIELRTESIYTSIDGDLLENQFNNKAELSIFNMTSPYDIHFFQWSAPGVPDTTNLRNNASSTYTKAYNMKPIFVHVTDAASKKDSVDFAGADWVNERYHFYTDNYNRPGDWLWLQSYTMYGMNIYNNAHMVESITQRDKSVYVKYDIDAFNLVTRTTVDMKDSVLNKTNYTYNIEWERF